MATITSNLPCAVLIRRQFEFVFLRDLFEEHTVSKSACASVLFKLVCYVLGFSLFLFCFPFAIFCLFGGVSVRFTGVFEVWSVEIQWWRGWVLRVGKMLDVRFCC